MYYKYVLNCTSTVLELPKASKILSVGFQGDTLVVWVDTSTHETEAVTLYAYCTGEEAKKGQIYVGTAMTANERFVLHVYRDFNMSDLAKGWF